MGYVICLNCGKVTPEREFCLYCHSPLLGAFEPPQTKEGIKLAYTKSGFFRLPTEYFGYHFAFYGVTGSGKTRAAMNLAIRAENNGLNLCILDVEGEWKNIIPKLRKEVEYYEVDTNLRVNPFELEDLGLTKLLLRETIFKGIELEYQDLSPQMNFLLDKCLLRSKSIPELIDNIIYHYPETPFRLRNLDATRTALLTRLNPYRDNPVLRRIFFVKRSSIGPGSFKDGNLIVDLHNLDKRVAYKRELRLIYNCLATAYLREALNREESSAIRNMFIADEAQLLVPRILKKAIVTDTWATTDFATRLRKRGESLVIISQSPSNIEDDIRKNAQNVFIFRLQDLKDIRAVAGMLGYVQVDEVSYLASFLTSLKNRRAVVKTPLASNPFLIRSLDLELEKVDEERLKGFMPRIDEKEELEEDELELLRSVEEYPFMQNTERAYHLGWHRSRFSKARKSLLEKGLLEEVSFKTKAKGAPSHFLKLKGKENYGKGGFIHAYWVNEIYGYLRRKGHEPVKEFSVDGKMVDIAFDKDGELVFVEVEYKSDWKSNMLRAMELCDRLILVFVRKRDCIEARHFLKERKLEKILATHVHSFDDILH